MKSLFASFAIVFGTLVALGLFVDQLASITSHKHTEIHH